MKKELKDYLIALLTVYAMGVIILLAVFLFTYIPILRENLSLFAGNEIPPFEDIKPVFGGCIIMLLGISPIMALFLMPILED